MARNKHLLLWSSLGCVVLLLVAAYQENFRREWRRIQAAAVTPDGPLEIRLRQVVVPALGVTDRCVSCHVGMAPGEQGVSGPRVLTAHPPVGHDPGELGCTVCHGGQGRATDRRDAHGEAPFWPEPMLPNRYAQSGCGSCHTHLAVPRLTRLRDGRFAFERHDCLTCHRLDGRGGTLRPDGGGMEGADLSLVAATGWRGDWYEHHLQQRAAASGGPWRESFRELPAADRESIDVLLASSVGAPKLVEGKALFHSLGCRGCHKVAGVGGDDGPDLTRVGQRDPGQLDFTHVPAERTVASWMAEHFRNPQKLVPGSQMPALGLSEQEIDALTGYILSLRRSEVPEAYWPKDRIRVERFGEREFTTDGATLYGTFCAACHGGKGQGVRYPGSPAFPAIASPDFLSLASDEFVAETVRRGRPGRRMPGWGESTGGLRPAEVEAVVRHVRSLGGVAQEPDARPARWVKADARAGERLFAAHCASCHGAAGAGGEGPALRNPVLLKTASDTYLVETIRRGRRGTAMAGFARSSAVRPALADPEIESIVAYLREQEQP